MACLPSGVSCSDTLKIINMARVSLSLLVILISTISISQIQNGKFEITGKLSGFPDSTIIYLYENKGHEPFLIDSALLINNEFHFTGSLKNGTNQVILQIKGSNNYKYFWLENSTITFTAEKEKFREAIITGSKTQDEQNQFDITSGDDKGKTISFIRNHPNSIISASFLSIYASTWGKDTSSILYWNLSKKIKNTFYGKNIFEFITINRSPKVGDSYVDFTEPNVEGKNISLSDFKGKVVLLDFWGSWCGPCRANNPKLVKIYNEFNSKGFEILGVAAEIEKKDWIDAINKDGLIWENVTDLKNWNNKAALIYGIYKYPTNYLIDRSGIIVAIDLEDDALRNKLSEMLN